MPEFLSFPFRLVLGILVVYRISYLVTNEEAPFGWMGRFRSWLGQRVKMQFGLAWTVAEVFHCQLCAGVWVSLIVGLLITCLASGWLDVVLVIFGLAGGQTVLARLTDRD